EDQSLECCRTLKLPAGLRPVVAPVELIDRGATASRYEHPELVAVRSERDAVHLAVEHGLDTGRCDGLPGGHDAGIGNVTRHPSVLCAECGCDHADADSDSDETPKRVAGGHDAVLYHAVIAVV